MVKDVVVTGRLNVKDMMTYLLYHNYSKLGGILTGVFGVVGMIGAPIMFYTGDNISGAVLALVGFIYGIYTPMSFYSRARRHLRTNPVFKHDMTYIFTSDALKVAIYTGKNEILWQDIFRIKILRSQVLIYLKEKQALILPVRNFESTEDLHLVKNFVERNHLAIPHNRRLEVEIHDDEI